MPLVKPRTATEIVYQGDDLETLLELRRAAEIARERVEEAQRRQLAATRSNGRYGGDTSTAGTPLLALIARRSAAEKAYNEAVVEARPRALEVKLQSLGKRTFQSLMKDHPPRTEPDGEGVPQVIDDDAELGVNTETFPLALLTYVKPGDPESRTMIEPAFATAADRQDFLEEELPDGVVTKLWRTAFNLNRGQGADPKASLYLTETETSSAT